MQIIFDSEEEKEQIIKSLANEEICPESLFLYDTECNGNEDNDCENCWRKALN